MLFMGTKKYPTENAYDSFLSSNGGSDNAYTELEYTLYHFDIPQEKLFKALDMFGTFLLEGYSISWHFLRYINYLRSATVAFLLSFLVLTLSFFALMSLPPQPNFSLIRSFFPMP